MIIGDRRLRVLHVARQFHPCTGGVERFVIDLCRHMGRLGVRSDVLTLDRSFYFPGTLPAMARVLTVELNEEAVAYPYDVLQTEAAINDVVGGEEIVVIWQPGTASALDSSLIAEGADVGAGASFSREVGGQMLTFSFDGENIIDDQTGSRWDVFGKAISGELTGSQLEPVVSVNHFWFSWAAFKPDTRIYEG